MKHVLLVDDDPDIRELVALALEGSEGFDLVTCADAETALQAYQSRRPDLVVLDVNLPDRSGADLMQDLGAAGGSHPPVVFLTADTQASEKARLMDLGAAGVIEKPFDILSLEETLQAFT